MAELRDQVSQYIGFKPNEICLPITEEDRWLFSKIIADQEGMADIIMGDYQFYNVMDIMVRKVSSFILDSY